MPWMSRVPDAITNLIAALNAWPGLSGVIVQDGPEPISTQAMEVISIGYRSEDDESAVTGTMVNEGMVPAPSREQFSIRCVIDVQTGQIKMAVPRARAYELLGEVGGAVAADISLAGAVMMAQLGEANLMQESNSTGAKASIDFSVDCDAFTGQ